MTLKNIQELYQETLKDLYPISEIDSLFYLVAEKLLKQDKIHLQFSKNDLLKDEESKKFQQVLSDLKTSKPIQYILEEAYFYDLHLYVNEHVLIPRFETEELVEWILERVKDKEIQSILDIGTGSGCIPLALKNSLPQVEIFGMDVSEEALKVARINARKNDLFIHWVLQDILILEDWGLTEKLDIIVSNPPYIPFDEKKLMSANVLDYEPPLALFVEDKNPLIFYERIAYFALKHLKEGGFLFFEMNEFNAQRVKSMLKDKGFSKVFVKKDINEKERMILGIK